MKVKFGDDALYRAELSADGRVIDRLVLTRCAVMCACCQRWVPIAEVGLRYVSSSKELRNQPRCTTCRKHKGKVCSR